MKKRRRHNNLMSLYNIARKSQLKAPYIAAPKLRLKVCGRRGVLWPNILDFQMNCLILSNSSFWSWTWWDSDVEECCQQLCYSLTRRTTPAFEHEHDGTQTSKRADSSSVIFLFAEQLQLLDVNLMGLRRRRVLPAVLLFSYSSNNSSFWTWTCPLRRWRVQHCYSRTSICPCQYPRWYNNHHSSAV